MKNIFLITTILILASCSSSSDSDHKDYDSKDEMRRKHHKHSVDDRHYVPRGIDKRQY